jgi:DNA polymerase-3 subunit epsilon
LRGKRVCFTGELQARIDGGPVTRAVAQQLAAQAGLVVANSVTKKLDLLVAADPNTLSGKGRKARHYGTRIVAEAAFWRMLGVAVE